MGKGACRSASDQSLGLPIPPNPGVRSGRMRNQTREPIQGIRARASLRRSGGKLRQRSVRCVRGTPSVSQAEEECRPSVTNPVSTVLRRTEPKNCSEGVYPPQFETAPFTPGQRKTSFPELGPGLGSVGTERGSAGRRGRGGTKDTLPSSSDPLSLGIPPPLFRGAPPNAVPLFSGPLCIMRSLFGGGGGNLLGHFQRLVDRRLPGPVRLAQRSKVATLFSVHREPPPPQTRDLE